MSNKTSDKNVANLEDSIMLLEEIINGDKECLEIDIRNNNYEDIEHWKREIKAVENVVNAYYREKARADKLENDYSKLLTETDEKDKQIQELEKELENNIPKQVIKDKIEELKTKRRGLGFKKYLRREDMLNEDRTIFCEIQVLQELLGTK